MPAYIYLTSDGPTPLKAVGWDTMPIWGNKGLTTPYVDGLLQEKRARFGACESRAFRDGERGRNRAAAGRRSLRRASQANHRGPGIPAQFLAPNNATPPANLAFHVHPTWEIAYNHYHNRMGVDLPKMAAVLARIRPTGVNHQMAWETLTHAEVGDAGLPPLNPR